MRKQARGQRHPALELFGEFRRRVPLFFDPGVEQNGDAPVVVARKFTHHQLRGLGGRLPINVMMMVARKVLPDRVKIAPTPFRATFDPAKQRGQPLAEIVQGEWRRVNYNLSVRLQTPPVFDAAEWEPGMT